MTDEIPFGEAKDQYAKLARSAEGWPKDVDVVVLSVVSGRSTSKAKVVYNSKKEPKAVEKPKSKAKVAAVAAMVAAMLVPAWAQQDITTLLPANPIAATTTNTSDSASFRWQDKDVLVLQATVTAADAGASNVVFKLDTSVDGNNWVPNVHSVTYTANGSNVAKTAIARITNSAGSLYWKITSTANQQTNQVTLSGVNFYLTSQ